MTPAQRNRIVRQFREGWSVKAIAAERELPVIVIEQVIREWMKSEVGG